MSSICSGRRHTFPERGLRLPFEGGVNRPLKIGRRHTFPERGLRLPFSPPLSFLHFFGRRHTFPERGLRRSKRKTLGLDNTWPKAHVPREGFET